MNTLTNKRILLGVTGGIAAYKSAEIIRLLKTAGADVKVVMTAGAMEFITPLTLQALSGNPVHTTLLNTEAEAAMGHIELARWGDLILVAPASANFIARASVGEGSDLLTTLLLASNSKILIAPAMNVNMWNDTSTQSNCEQLAKRGFTLIGPASGSQACGDEGLGRMEAPEIIAEACAAQFESKLLSGKKVVITAGPTREAIDPVRYISNNSSGKMGFALAEAAINAGASVDLISGPVNLETPDRVKRTNVLSAQQMLEQALSCAESCDIFIACAAVADFRPEQVATQKLKKDNGQDNMNINLVKNPDIVAQVSESNPSAYILGFAAETQNLEANAQAKLKAKGLNMIAANDVSDENIGFNSEQNAVTLYIAGSDNETVKKVLNTASKTVIASQILENVSKQINKN